jgi:hypothetical protein
LKNPVESVALGLSYLAAATQATPWVHRKYELDLDGSDGNGRNLDYFARKYAAYILDLPESNNVTDGNISDAMAELKYRLQDSRSRKMPARDAECLSAGEFCYRLVEIEWLTRSKTQIIASCNDTFVDDLFVGLNPCTKTKLTAYLSDLFKVHVDKVQKSIDNSKKYGRALNNAKDIVIGLAMMSLPVKNLPSKNRIIKLANWIVQSTAQYYLVDAAVTLPIEGIQLLIEGSDLELNQQLLSGLSVLIEQRQQSKLSDEEFYKRLQDGAISVRWIPSFKT